MSTLKKITAFIQEKKKENYEVEQVKYLVPGGSFVSGTNDETSDFDFRGIVTLDMDHYFGLRNFTHQKMVSGTHGINMGEDMDVEIFELFHWLEGLKNGEIIPFEMAHINTDLILSQDPLLLPIFENLPLFLSKKVVGNYYGFVQKCLQRMHLPAKNFKKEISSIRVQKFDYETKEAMNAVKVLRLTNELMKEGQVSLFRSDREELMSIKRGEVSKLDIEKQIRDLLLENKSLFNSCNILPKEPDFEKLNVFFRDYKQKTLKELGMLS